MRKTRTRNIIIVIVSLLVIFIIGYFVYSYTQLSNKNIPINSLEGKLFISLDEEIKTIIDTEKVTISVNEKETIYKLKAYQENILEITTETEKLYIVILDENTIYLGAIKKYLYYL